MAKFKTKQEAEEHIKQIAEDVARKFENDIKQMSPEEVDNLKQQLNGNFSEAEMRGKAEEYQQKLNERRKNLPKEEQVLFDTYSELLDDSRVSGFCSFGYVYVDKDGNYQDAISTRNQILGVSFVQFCKDIKELVETVNKYEGTFVCLLNEKLHATNGNHDEFYNKLHDTYDFNKFFAELYTSKYHHCTARQDNI